jgi:hypothetical protein
MSTDLGAVRRLVWLVTDENGQPANPGTATLNVTVGTGPPVAVPVTLPPAVKGTVIADFATTAAGLHRADWVTTGPISAGSDYFNVRSYLAVCSLEDARAHLGYPDGVQDAKIRALLGAATRVAESVVGTCVIRTFTGDWISGYSRQVLQLPHRPVPSTSAVTAIRSVYTATGGPSWTGADLIVNREAGTVRLASQLAFWGGPWLADYSAGRIEIGENIVNGTLDVLWDLFSTQRAGESDAEYPSAQEVANVEALIPPGYELPSHALEQLEPDRMPAFG